MCRSAASIRWPPSHAATWAALALVRGERPAALRQVEPIPEVLARDQQVGLDEPFYVNLVCYRVLRAAADRRTDALLLAAQDLLRQYASRIDDPPCKATS